jgi:predicted nuclease of restriction endonuclease-like RecB superfamily
MFTEESVSARRLKTGLKPVFLSIEKDRESAETAIAAFNSGIGKPLSTVLLSAVSKTAKKKPITGLVHALFMIQESELEPSKKKISALDVAVVSTELRANQTYPNPKALSKAVASHFDITLERLDSILAEDSQPRVHKETQMNAEQLIAVYNFEYWNLLHKLAQSPRKANWHQEALFSDSFYKKPARISWAGKSVSFAFGDWTKQMTSCSDALKALSPSYLP